METCKNCSSDLVVGLTMCPTCKFPHGGTEKEQAVYIARQVTNKADVKESIDRVKKSRNLLFILAAIHFVAPIFTLYRGTSSIAEAAVYFISAILFLVFALLSYKRPKFSLLIPFVGLGLLYLLTLTTAPEEFFKGILWKVVFMVILGYGFFSVNRAEKILAEYPYLAKLMGHKRIDL